jgi:rubrerythrin
MPKALKGSKTHDNLKAAFAGESQANRRYLYFAAKADVEGHNDVSALFRSTAEGETGHAHGHLEYMEAVGDPATNLPIGRTRENLKAAVAGETHEYTDMYPGMAKQARDEGFARSPTGSRPWRRRSAAMPTASKKPWTPFPTRA